MPEFTDDAQLLGNNNKLLCSKILTKYGYTAKSRESPYITFDGTPINKEPVIVSPVNAKPVNARPVNNAATSAEISKCRNFLISKKFTVSDRPVGGRRSKCRRKTIKSNRKP